MKPIIDNPLNIQLVDEAIPVIDALFFGYKRVIVEKEFKEGLSGSQVIRVRAIREDGISELPAAVKIAPLSQIEKEIIAYEKHIRDRLYYVAYLTAAPVKLPEIGWGGLRYALMGGEKFETTTLLDYLSRADVTHADAYAVVDYLMRTMYDLWSQHKPDDGFSYQQNYDTLLPVHYLLGYQTGAKNGVHTLHPQSWSSKHFSVNDIVKVSDHIVHKVNLSTKTMTLQAPILNSKGMGPLLRVRASDPQVLQAYRLKQTVSGFTGKVIETRRSRLEDEVDRAFNGKIDVNRQDIEIDKVQSISLKNPLFAYDTVLDHQAIVKVASIHGDLNLTNVLVEPERRLISLIDFSESRTDHVLHDLLQLERDVVTRLLPEVVAQMSDVPPISILAYLYDQLNHIQNYSTTSVPESLPIGLQKCWAILSRIRQEVRYFLYEPDQFEEYYRGLFLYLLGSIKFKNLNSQSSGESLAKQLAFWGAGLVYEFLSEDSVTANTKIRALSRPFSMHGQNGNSPLEEQRMEVGQQSRSPVNLPTGYVPEVSAALPTGSRMPLGRNPAFTGRRDELQKIATAFQSDSGMRMAAVTGLGGLGKTQLASEFVYRYGKYFPGGVFWLNFAQAADVPAEIAACGGAHFMALRPDFDELPQAEQLGLVLARWQHSSSYLLIFDNCEEGELLDEWVSRLGNAHILLTSRRSDWPSTVNRLPLSPLRRSDAIFLLRSYYHDETDEVLSEIAAEVGDLPLALHMSGSYLKQNRDVLTPRHYLDQLQDERYKGSLLVNRYESARAPSPHQASIERTIRLSYDQLDDANYVDKDAKQILGFVACLSPGEQIDEELLQFLGGETLSSQDQFDESVGRLVALGLIQEEIKQSELSNFRMHRLIGDFVSNNFIDFKPTKHQTGHAIENLLEGLLRLGDMLQIQKWQPHLRWVIEVAQNDETENGAKLGELFSEYLRDIGDYEGSRELIERSVDIYEMLNDVSRVSIARCWAELGYIYHRLKNKEVAWQFFARALNIQLEALGENDPQLAVTYNKIGHYLQIQGQFDQARDYHLKALNIRRQTFETNHPATAESLINLAFIYFSTGSLIKAEVNLKQAWRSYYESYGQQHHKTLSVLHYLAELALAQKDLTRAKKICRDVLRVRRVTLPANHPDLARIVDLIGVINMEEGKLERAKACLEIGLKSRLEVLGAEHVLTADSYIHLGDLGRKSGRAFDAIANYKHAQLIYKSRLGGNAPQTLKIKDMIERLESI